MSEGMEGKKLVNISAQLIEELDALSEAVKVTTNITEKKFKETKFPLRFNDKTHRYEWDDKEIRKFYEDSENASRTIYCREVNVDETDNWGLFGYTPGFLYIERKKYEGVKTLNDQASSVGLSIGVDPKTGLGVMNHFDFFPKHKYGYQMIRRTEYPELFNLMCAIFTKRKIGNTKQLG